MCCRSFRSGGFRRPSAEQLIDRNRQMIKALRAASPTTNERESTPIIRENSRPLAVKNPEGGAQ